MADHAQRLVAAELVEGAAQDFPAFEVVGDGAIPQVNAVMQKQPVLAGHFQMVCGGHGRDQRLASVCRAWP